MTSTKILKAGNTAKPNPFTICIVANRLLEAPQGSGLFIADPIISDQAGFDACADYIVSCLYGTLPQQREGILADPAIANDVKIVSIFDPSAPDPEAADRDVQSLVAQDRVSFLLMGRRIQAKAYLAAAYGKVVDVVYAVSGSTTHTRASAWFATDDPTNMGTPFALDAVSFTHCFNSFTPGTIAIHKTANTLTATHEFGHALSSYQNGMVVDLYESGHVGLNCKSGRPIPANFSTYNGTVFQADQTRGLLSYPAGWTAYNCQRNGAAPGGPDLPAIMDNYYIVPAGFVSEQCEHDMITRRFLKDRLATKVGRP